MKIFISQPFHGLTEEQVMAKRQRIVELLDERGYPNIEIIDNYHKADVPDGAGRVWYLGDSIRQMDEADLVVFTTNYREAKGCMVEFKVALLYSMRFVFEWELRGG